MHRNKWLTMMLALLLALGMTACGKDGMGDKNDGGESPMMETPKASGMMSDDMSGGMKEDGMN